MSSMSWEDMAKGVAERVGLLEAIVQGLMWSQIRVLDNPKSHGETCAALGSHGVPDFDRDACNCHLSLEVVAFAKLREQWGVS